MARKPRKTTFKNRIQKLRAEVKIDTQKLRNDILQTLQELFTMAKQLAQNPELKLPQRQKWTRAAAYICQVINSTSQTLDTRQIDEDLQKLEQLVNEATTRSRVVAARAFLVA